MENKLKKGQKIIAVDPCIMEYSKRPTLTVGKEYEVIRSGIDAYNRNSFSVIDDENDPHDFDIEEFEKFFKLKSE